MVISILTQNSQYYQPPSCREWFSRVAFGNSLMRCSSHCSVPHISGSSPNFLALLCPWFDPCFTVAVYSLSIWGLSLFTASWSCCSLYFPINFQCPDLWSSSPQKYAWSLFTDETRSPSPFAASCLIHLFLILLTKNVVFVVAWTNDNQFQVVNDFSTRLEKSSFG